MNNNYLNSVKFDPSSFVNNNDDFNNIRKNEHNKDSIYNLSEYPKPIINRHINPTFNNSNNRNYNLNVNPNSNNSLRTSYNHNNINQFNYNRKNYTNTYNFNYYH